MRRIPHPARRAAFLVGCTVMAFAPHATGALSSKGHFNDPGAPYETSNLVVDRIEGTPSDGEIRIVTFNLSDGAIAAAIQTAARRGVDVKLIMARGNCDTDEAKQVIGTLGDTLSAPNWVKCVRGSARRAGGGSVHQKSYTFSETRGTKWVTLVGSANPTDENNDDHWNDLYEYADRKDIYDAYNAVFRLQRRGHMARPYRTFSFSDGKARANFFPVNAATPGRADDPVYDRIKNLPGRVGNRRTVIWVATYAMQGRRGAWLRDALIAKKREGALISVITGPPVPRRTIERPLRQAGIRVVQGYEAGCRGAAVESSCNYIHLKLMTAKYFENGVWEYRSYTGSDNWSDEGLTNDEVIQRIAGPEAYNDYTNFMKRIWSVYRGAGP